MKREAKKNGKLGLWLGIGIAVLAVVAGIVLALVLGGGNDVAKDMGGRPELYWNVDRLAYTENSESGLSTREPGEDGLYHIRFAIDGQIVEYAVADKQLVNYIDVLEVMALTLDSEGVIVDVHEPEEVATVIGKRLYLQEVGEDTIIANSSLAMNGMRFEIKLSDLSHIYEVSDEAETVGQIVDTSAFLPLDTIGVFANGNGEVTHVYIIEHTEQSPIYWRAQQFYNSTLKQTTRVPDADGVYSMDFYCDGELVTLKTRDVTIVNHVDSRDRYACAKGFLFDEEGFVIGELDPAIGTRTINGCERFDVTELSGDMVYTEKLWNPDGSVFSCKIAEDCVIYDVSETAQAEGRRGKPVDSLQLGDRVCIWKNTQGEAVIIYVACRTVEADIFYLPATKYDSTLKQSTRTPNSQGYYEVELLKVGENANRIFKTKDKTLIDYLDSQNTRTVGLILEGDIIQRVYSSESLFGYTPLTRGGTVPSVSGSIFSRMTYGKPDSLRNSLLDANCKIYNVSDVGTYGAETTLQEGDRIYAHRRPTGEAIFIFVTQRKVGFDHLYWNVTRSYDNQTKSTTREPDENGWYVFEMIHRGKEVTLKTRSKSLASKIDAQSGCAVGLDVSGDVIVKVYGAQNVTGGSLTMNGYRVKEIRSDGVITVWYGSGTAYRERVFKCTSDCVIYNVSDAYSSHRGETVSSLKVGDMVVVLTNIYADAEVVYIRYREVDNMYWKVDRFYDTVNLVTSREPDADGWYVYDLAVNGEVKTFKTKDKELATKMDAYNSAFGLLVKGDEILSFVPTNWVRNVGFTGVTNWEVTAINGRKVTVTYTLPGSSNTGKTQTITLASGAKVYDVSPSAASFGEATTLKVGDQIRTYQNESNTEHLYVYVQHRANRVEGVDAYCAHCDTVVHWNPYAGGSIVRTSGHYYLSGDCKTADQLGVGNENSDYEIVLDLNGKTLTRLAGGRFALVRFGDTLTIMDSVGGGKIVCQGAEGWNGGVMYVDGGHVNLLGGTLEMDGQLEHKWGGVLYLTESTFQMSGGTIIGGYAQRGGSIYNTGASVITMTGGTITGGHCTKEAGGNIYLMGGTTMMMSGGTVSGGTSVGRAGNIHVDSAVFEATGGVITGGTSERSADGICINSSASSVKLNSVTVEDRILVRYMGELVLCGTVKIAHLEIPVGKLFTVGEMESGAQVYVNTTGTFTYEFDNAQTYADAGYFLSAVEKMEVGVTGNALCLQGEKVYCAHCDQKVAWAPWSADATIEGTTVAGEATHFWLEGDFTAQTAQRSVTGNVVLDLRGYNYTTTGIRNFLVSGNFTVMDSVGTGAITADGAGATNEGSVAYVNGDAAVFTLLGGTLRQGEGSTVKNGGVIAVNRGTVKLLGGTVIGHTVTGNGSAVANNRYCTMEIGNVTVQGSIYVTGNSDKNASVQITGGDLEEILVNDKVDLTVSGAPVIDNLDLTGGRLITLGELAGADITVTAEGVFTNENANAAGYKSFFKSSDGQQIVAAGNVLRVGEEPVQQILCPHCGDAVEWLSWTGATKPASGHYYIDTEFTSQTGQCAISSGTEVILDLRGNAYTTTGIRNFLVSGNFTIVDTVGTGVITADGTGTSGEGTVAYVNGDAAVFTLMGGTLRQSEGSTVKNGGVITVNRGTVKLLGGTVIGHTVTGNGSAVANNRYCTMEIGNVTIQGSVYVTGNSDKNASVQITGGNLEEILVNDKVDLTVSGAPVIGNLDLSGGKKITLGALTDGTNITVTAEGVFTNSSTSAAHYYAETYFHTTAAGMTVALEGDTLAVTDSTSDPDAGEEETEQYPLNLVYDQAVKMTTDGVFAESNADENGVVVANCPYCGAENAQWNKLTAITTKETLDGTVSHYYLAGDLENDAYYSVKGAVCLHLNGHNITSSERVAQIESAGTLNIMGNGILSGSYSSTNTSYMTFGSTLDVIGNANLCGGTYVRTDIQPIVTGRATLNDGESRSINVYRGTTIQGDTTYTGSACVYLSNSHIFNLYGGKVTGGYNPEGNGGNIALVAGSYRNRVSQINIYGGTVENGTAAKGGNIYLGGANKSNSKGRCTGILNIVDGTVTGGTATSGADVYICGSTTYEDLSATISGGTIGSVYVEAGTQSFTVSGAPVITQLELASGAKITLGEMTENADIQVLGADGAFTLENSNASQYEGYFRAVASGKTVKVENSTLIITDAASASALQSRYARLCGML